jgi:acetyltransferase-like isoleucine patch superfamily enzyme
MFYYFYHLKVFFWTLFYRIFGAFSFHKIGRDCTFEGWIDVPRRGGRVILGNGVRVCRMVELSVSQGAELCIGENVFIGRGVLINTQESISIGDYSQIAEHVAIHDNNHVFRDANRLIVEQGMETRPVVIGNDTWIGAYSLLTAGASVPDGCVVGAKSLITSTTQSAPYSVIVGSPGRVIGARR